KARGGQAVAGEALYARVFDLGQRRWLTRLAEIAPDTSQKQAQHLIQLAALQLPGVPAAPGKPVAAAPKKAESSGWGGFKLPFTRTKWYSWVIAGGVVALIG